MQVLILNSGIGKRLGNLTTKKPKCLLELSNKETILSRQIDFFLKSKINDIIITTGPFENLIKEYLHTKYPENQFKLINNPNYLTTNYIYSMYLACPLIIDDCLLIHGDLVFSSNLISMIINSPYKNCVTVNSSQVKLNKDFKAQIYENKVKQISVDLIDDEYFSLMPFYKLSKNFSSEWFKVISIFINRNDVNVYAENALNEILHKIDLFALEWSLPEFCFEVDNIDDYKMIKKFLNIN